MNEEDNKDMYESFPTESERNDIKNALQRLMVPVPDVDAAWERINRDIKDDSHSSNLRYITISILAVASIVLFLVLKFGYHPQDSHEVFSYKSGIGKDVTITTDDNETQPVKQTAMSFDVKKRASADGDVSTVLMETPRGKDYHLTLPDGTKVWLNAESSIQFPTRFTGKERMVHISGEAYFEVTKDKNHPFIVETNYFSTKVLGTTFNVCAYSEKDASLVLIEGHVVASSPDHRIVQSLVPGEKMQCSGTDRMRVTTINTYPYTQRKEGYFYFDNESLFHIMIELGRWYNKTIVFENNAAMKTNLHFVSLRKLSLPDVISSLNDIDGVNIELGNNEIVVN